jgi:hypothetical protein
MSAFLQCGLAVLSAGLSAVLGEVVRKCLRLCAAALRMPNPMCFCVCVCMHVCAVCVLRVRAVLAVCGQGGTWFGLSLDGRFAGEAVRVTARACSSHPTSPAAVTTPVHASALQLFSCLRTHV